MRMRVFVSQVVELWPGIPCWLGNQVKPRDLLYYLEHMKGCGHRVIAYPCTRTPEHVHILGHGVGFGFNWRNRTEHIRGHYSVQHAGIRT